MRKPEIEKISNYRGVTDNIYLDDLHRQSSVMGCLRNHCDNHFDNIEGSHYDWLDLLLSTIRD